MDTRHLKSLLQIAAVWGAATLAATVWAGGITEEGYILEAGDWRSEVAAVPSTDWPVDGWYRVAIGREDGAAGFPASYQFLLTRVVR